MKVPPNNSAAVLIKEATSLEVSGEEGLWWYLRLFRLACATSYGVIGNHTVARDLFDRGQLSYVLYMCASLGNGRWMVRHGDTSNIGGETNIGLMHKFVKEAKKAVRRHRKEVKVQIRELETLHRNFQLALDQFRDEVSESEDDSARSTPTVYSLPSGCSGSS